MNFYKKNRFNVFALHGFLGLPSDWNQFDFIDFPIRIERNELELWEWSGRFNANIKKTSHKNILLGYSLGGRLAMHALLSNPDLWDGAIIVSAHPGLTSAAEREARLSLDRQWAARFLNDSWEPLMNDWNANSVFANLPFPFQRNEKDFNRKNLSENLLNWSLGHQEPLSQRLEKLSIPILFLAGDLDTKYCHVAKQCSHFAEVSIIPNAAHRLPWDQPNSFIKKIDKFIGGL